MVKHESTCTIVDCRMEVVEWKRKQNGRIVKIRMEKYQNGRLAAMDDPSGLP